MGDVRDYTGMERTLDIQTRTIRTRSCPSLMRKGGGKEIIASIKAPPLLAIKRALDNEPWFVADLRQQRTRLGAAFDRR